jgi:hypothetical protein
MTKARDIASAAPAPAGVTSTELGYVDGVTSALQTQVDAKIAKTLTTTTGDIIYASGANTPARLGVGSTGNVLTVSGGVPAWAAPAGGGKVLQVVNVTYATSATSSSTTYADTGLTATITPTSATSTILVLVTQAIAKDVGNTNSACSIRLLRGATAIKDVIVNGLYTDSSVAIINTTAAINYLDSPATTSATTYKTQFNQAIAANRVWVNFGGSPASITLLEIGA